jgi:hypothetical protein
MGCVALKVAPEAGTWREVVRRAALVSGGCGRLAKRIGTSRTSIYVWLYENREPRLPRHRQALLDIAEEWEL